MPDQPLRSPGESSSSEPKSHQIKAGDLECPRCKKNFTMSYWRGEQLIQARCLSCDLKWPRPDVV
jgi:Zn ribbon nucleic-acid-binding protein